MRRVAGRWPSGAFAMMLVGLIVTDVSAGPVPAAGFDRGRALYENHCVECHGEWAHTRKGRVVNSMAGLRAKVEAWSTHSGLGWSEEEIEDVTRYLNERFYHLNE